MNTSNSIDLLPAIRQVWPPQAPSAELRARTVAGALGSLRGARSRRARALSVRLAAALYMCFTALAGLAFLALGSDGAWSGGGPVSRLAAVALGVAAALAGAIASVTAARWCSETDLVRWPRWLPAAGSCAAAGLIIIAGLAQTRAAPGDAGAQPARDPLAIVSRAFTATMTTGEAQAWLNDQLTPGVERAWFITPDGLIALSSITTANEISRSVLDFVLTPQWREWMTLTQAAAISHPVSAAGLSLAGGGRLTAAGVYSPPIALAAIAREALRMAAGEPSDRDVSAVPVLDAGGRLIGIAAASQFRRPAAAGGGFPLPAGALAGLTVLSASWSIWIYWIEQQRRHGAHPAAWAAFTALLPPVGVLLRLLNPGDPTG